MFESYSRVYVLVPSWPIECVYEIHGTRIDGQLGITEKIMARESQIESGLLVPSWPIQHIYVILGTRIDGQHGFNMVQTAFPVSVYTSTKFVMQFYRDPMRKNKINQ